MSNLLKMAVRETIRPCTAAAVPAPHRRRAGDQPRDRRPSPPTGGPAVKTSRCAPRRDAGRRGAKTSDAPPGSEGDEGAAELTPATRGSTPDPQPRGSGRASGCEPWRGLIRAKCHLGLTAQRIYQDLVSAEWGRARPGNWLGFADFQQQHMGPKRSVRSAWGSAALIGLS